MTPRFPRYAAPIGTPIELPSMPPKTTFGGPRSAEGQRIRSYLAEIGAMIAPWLEDRAMDIGMHLDIGLPAGSNVLVHHDLDNFLEPLAAHLGAHRISRASATKRIAPASTLTIASAMPGEDPRGGWQTATIEGPGLSRPGQRALGRALARQASPLAWGPVELEVSLRIGAERNPVAAWKPLIDSLVAILGRAPGKSEFDIEDGRIVALAIHQEVDQSLGHAVQARLWWRLAGSAVSAGPALDYEVGAGDELPALARAAPRETTAATIPRAEEFEVIATLARFRDVQASAEGYVIITDTANPPRMHRAGCAGVREENFVGKVIDRAMRNGKYLYAVDPDGARRRWPRLSEHRCVGGWARI